MRKVELYLGIAAGLAGVTLAVLSLLGVLTYLDGKLVQTSAYILIGANVVGIAGALMVNRHNFIGSGMMLVTTAVVLVFGFPWQSLPAVVYIMSVVLAVVPVRMSGRKSHE